MIDVIIEEEGWENALPDAEKLAADCMAATVKIEPAARGEIALLMTNSDALCTLNAKFRSINKPTNVLSFPSGGRDFLGDIALAYEVCRDEAAEKGIALRDHAAHLIIHGILHLVGYDHLKPDDAAVMEQREIEILKTLGINNPYADAVEHV